MDCTTTITTAFTTGGQDYILHRSPKAIAVVHAKTNRRLTTDEAIAVLRTEKGKVAFLAAAPTDREGS